MNLLVEGALQNPLFIRLSSHNKIHFHVLICKIQWFYMRSKEDAVIKSQNYLHIAYFLSPSVLNLKKKIVD
jgi:hypothetical protein